jgi:hypothetical protein
MCPGLKCCIFGIDALLPWGSIERVLLELYTHALGRSREYACVPLLFTRPTDQQKRRWPNHCVLGAHAHDSYLRLADFKTSKHVGNYRIRLSPSLHKAIMLSLQQHPRNFLFEQPTAPGSPFRDACNWNHWVNRCFKRMFKRPVTANSLRHRQLCNVT